MADQPVGAWVVRVGFCASEATETATLVSTAAMQTRAAAADHRSLKVTDRGLHGAAREHWHLDAGLADVDGDHFAHGGRC